MPSLWEVLKTSKGLPAPDGFTALFARSLSDTYTLTEISGIPPLNLGEIVEIVDYTIYGNIYQSDGVSPDTPQEVVGVGERTGNLFDKNDCTVEEYINLNGNISKAAHWFTTENYIKCSGTITITALNGLGSGAYITCYDEQKNLLGVCRITDTNQNQVTINLIDGTKYIKTCCRDDNFDSFMLNSGSTPLPYEPYGYKVDVECRGKNLINIIPFKATFGTGSAVIRNFLNSLDVGAYVVSYNTELLTRNDTTDNSIYGIRVINESGNFELTPSWSSASIGTVKKISLKIIITEDNKRKFTNVYFYGCGMFSVGVTGSANISDFQLEAGSTATSYEPYTPPITTPIYLDSPLYKIGDYSDSVSMTEEVRAIKELVLTGDENWQIYNDNIRVYQFYTDLPTGELSISGLSAYSNTAQYGATANNRGNYVFGCYPVTNGTQIAFQMQGAKEQFVGISAWKSYLASQYANGTPVTVYYVLAEPETKAVEPVEIPTIQGTNIIDINTEVKPSRLKITYKSRR